MAIPSRVKTPRRLLRDLVHDRILDAIISGELEAGKVLVDKELEDWLGTSRTPIRDALNRLSGVGLVEVLPQKFTRVALIDLDQFIEMIDVMGALLSAAVFEVTPLLSENEQAELLSLQQALPSDSPEGATEDLSNTINSLFTLFAVAYGNAAVLRVFERFQPHFQRTMRVLGDSLQADQSLGLLRDLVTAALGGNANEAADAAEEYFEANLNRLKEISISTVQEELNHGEN